jgi:hypothetical protein
MEAWDHWLEGDSTSVGKAPNQNLVKFSTGNCFCELSYEELKKKFK